MWFSHGLHSPAKRYRPSQVREIKRFGLCAESASRRLAGISAQPRTSIPQAYLEVGCVRFFLQGPIFGVHGPTQQTPLYWEGS